MIKKKKGKRDKVNWINLRRFVENKYAWKEFLNEINLIFDLIGHRGV